MIDRLQVNLIGFLTIIRKEIIRFMRIWTQTLLPSAITTTLYFIIFGKLIGSQIGEMGGFTYMQFIVPGLLMMAVINSAYANVSASFYSLKFQRSIEEIIISPLANFTIVLGYITGGVLRGILVGIIVCIVSLLFTHLQIHHFGLMAVILIFSSILFSLAGFFNALFAKSFDDVMLIPTFVLTPLTYLGGVFYSLSMLPNVWQKISLLNPILYLVNGFRYSILGVSDIPVGITLSILIFCIVGFFSICWYLLKIGYGIRT